MYFRKRSQVIALSKFIPRFGFCACDHTGKSATNRESNHGSGVCKEHYAQYYVPKSSIVLAGTGVRTITSVACGFSSININYSDYPKSLISRINEVYEFIAIFY